MANLTQFAENEILQMYFAGVTPPLISPTMYIALSSTLPSDPLDVTFTEITETAYAAAARPSSSGGWTISSSGGVYTAKNANPVTFAVATDAGAPVYTIEAIGFFLTSVVAAGDLLMWGDVSSAPINQNDQYVLAVNNMTVEMK